MDNPQPLPAAVTPTPHRQPRHAAPCVPLFLNGPARLLIAPATLDDLPALLRIQASESNALGFLTTRALAQHIRNQSVYVAHTAVPTNAEATLFALPIVAYIISPRPRRYPPAETVQLVLQICVERKHRRRTIATALLNEVICDARTRGSIGLQATVAATLPATAFWRNAGFRLIGTRPANNARRRALHVYRLPLTNKLPLWFGFAHLNREPQMSSRDKAISSLLRKFIEAVQGGSINEHEIPRPVRPNCDAPRQTPTPGETRKEGE